MKLHEILQNYAAGYGFTANESYIGGQCAGRWFTLSMSKRGTRLTLETWIAQPEEEVRNRLLDLLDDDMEKLELEDFTCTRGHLMVRTKSSFLVSRKDIGDRVTALMEAIAGVLDQVCAAKGCAMCAAGPTDNKVSYNGKPLMICGECLYKTEKRLARKKERYASSVKRGVLGALLFSLLGCAVWVLVAYLGNSTSVTGAVIALLAALGFEMVGGPKNRTMSITVAAVTLFYVLLGNVGELVMIMMRSAGIGFGRALVNAFEFFIDPNVAGTVWYNVLMGVLYGALGGLWSVVLLLSEGKDAKPTFELLTESNDR